MWHVYPSTLCCPRFELSGLPNPAMVEDVAIKTTDNDAHKLTKQGVRGEPHELVSPPRAGGPTAAGMYEVPSPPLNHADPLPAIPPPVAKPEDKDEEGVYEIIPGDK